MLIVVFTLCIAGTIFFVLEQKNYKKRMEFVAQYISQIRHNESLDLDEKNRKIDDFFSINDFTKDGNRYYKKEFFYGAFMFFLGLAFVGVIFYLLYFRFFKKPDVFIVDFEA